MTALPAINSQGKSKIALGTSFYQSYTRELSQRLRGFATKILWHAAASLNSTN